MIKVTDIQPTVPDSSLHVSFLQGLLSPNTEQNVATVTFSCIHIIIEAYLINFNIARTKGLFKGKLLLRTNDSNPVNSRIEIPYKARVLPGLLDYQLSSVTFPVGM